MLPKVCSLLTVFNQTTWEVLLMLVFAYDFWKRKLIGVFKLWKNVLHIFQSEFSFHWFFKYLFFYQCMLLVLWMQFLAVFHLLSFVINPLGTNCSVDPKCYIYGKIQLGCYDLSKGRNGGFACMLVLFNWMSVLHLHLILGLSLSAWHRSSCHRTAPQCSYLPYCNFYSLQKC